MAYIPTADNYFEVIYSEDAKNRLRIWFNEVELEDADIYCEKLTRKWRVLPEDGNKVFSLNNFIAQELTLILHDIDLSLIQDQVKISIGTLVDEENEVYEDVPLGIFNIQDKPTTDGNKITILLRDNRVKFDFKYNAYDVITENGGYATKLQILEDICEQAGVETDITSFLHSDDLIGIYDNTISATQYIASLAEQACSIAVCDRTGKLAFMPISSQIQKTVNTDILNNGIIKKAAEQQIGELIIKGNTRQEHIITDMDNLYNINTDLIIPSSIRYEVEILNDDWISFSSDYRESPTSQTIIAEIKSKKLIH